ncbi:hypothetical protein CRYUN_Cryun23aG0069500 [Craigia yunnanensis]
MEKANVVINLIGREYETINYSFEEVNHFMAEQLAVIAKEHGGIMRFIQVSCLGSSLSSPSRFRRAKAAGEEAVLKELPEMLPYGFSINSFSIFFHLQATIMKPAVMIGTEDRIMNQWVQFAKKYSFLPLVGDGSTKIQPVYVVDVASAIVAALKDDGTSMGKAELMFDTIHEWPCYVNVPLPIAKAIAMPREVLFKKVPFSLPNPDIFNLDQIHAFSTDTVVSENALTFMDLGIGPHKLKGHPVEYLIQYRKGSPQFGSTVSEKVNPEYWP